MKLLDKLFNSNFAVHFFLALSMMNIVTGLMIDSILNLIVGAICGWCAFDADRKVTAFKQLRTKLPDIIPDHVVHRVLREMPKGAKLEGIIAQDEDGNHVNLAKVLAQQSSKPLYRSAYHARVHRAVKNKNKRLLKVITKRTSKHRPN